MDRFATIKAGLLRAAGQDEAIRAIIYMGSSTRTVSKADEYSDLDVILITRRPEDWLRGDAPKQLGELKISFVEPTFSGGEELRTLYDGSLDVDLIIFTPEQFEAAMDEGVAGAVLSRGYEIVFDAEGYSARLAGIVGSSARPAETSEAEFANMVNDFFFHTVWAYKKLLRSELWTAKMCVDSYLKSHLLKIIELYTVSKHHTDVWHNGRFLDQWCEADVLSELKQCFARYDSSEVASALRSTLFLFSRLAQQTAEMRRFAYPEEADRYAQHLLEPIL